MRYKLYDITLYYSGSDEIAKKFARKQNLVSDLYIQYLYGYKPPKTTRISVRLGDTDEVRGHFGNSILKAHAQFDNDKFWSLADKEQKMSILSTVHRIALLCAEKYDWDKDVFISAYNRVIDIDFKYEFRFRIKSSPNRQHKACLQLNKNEKFATLSVVFFDKSEHKIKEVELLKAPQHEMFYDIFLKMNKWFSNQDFGIYTKNEEIVIKASLDESESEIIIIPKKNSLEELEGTLRMITYKEFKSHADYVAWANK